MKSGKAAKNFWIEGTVSMWGRCRRLRVGTGAPDEGLDLEVLLLREGKPHSAVSIKGTAREDGTLALSVNVDGARSTVKGSRGTTKQRFWRAGRPAPTRSAP